MTATQEPQPVQLTVRADTSALERKVDELTAKVESIAAYVKERTSPGAYTPAQVAELLQVDVDLVYRLIRERQLQAVRITERNLRIPARALDAYLAGEAIPRGMSAKRVLPLRR